MKGWYIVNAKAKDNGTSCECGSTAIFNAYGVQKENTFEYLSNAQRVDYIMLNLFYKKSCLSTRRKGNYLFQSI